MRLLSHAEILSMMELVGRIVVRVDGPPGLHILIEGQASGDRPAVYAWASGGEILYIGKAGRGVAQRMKQHSAGFRHSARGRSHAEFLMMLISSGKAVELYAMWPEPVDMMGHAMPVHSAIEEWLIEVADPAPPRNFVSRS